MVKKATAEALGKNPATAISIVEPSGEIQEEAKAVEGQGGGCGDSKLEW
jgi:nitrite reductase (NAD(P)H)